MQRPITIVGGGLAGLTLGIALRREHVPVAVVETRAYPRHRVCGEFISGAGLAVLERMCLLPRLAAAGAVPARTVAFWSEQRLELARPLPLPAWSLSRFELDRVLADAFLEAGGRIVFETWRDMRSPPEGTVLATGRRASGGGRPRFAGLKAHVRNVPLHADLEMHFHEECYVGLCRLRDGKVNVCGLFWKAEGAPLEGRSRWEALAGAAGSELARRLQHAVVDPDSFCAVAGVSLRPERASDSRLFRIGDAITMIPPMTGNGMSMAFESAELATPALLAYSRGQMTWAAAQRSFAAASDRRFQVRLRWAWLLQNLLQRPGFRLFRILIQMPGVWSVIFSKTR